jgi:hypothetical protein
MEVGVQIFSCKGDWHSADNILVTRYGGIYRVERFLADGRVPIGAPTTDPDAAIERAIALSRK